MQGFFASDPGLELGGTNLKETRRHRREMPQVLEFVRRMGFWMALVSVVALLTPVPTFADSELKVPVTQGPKPKLIGGIAGNSAPLHIERLSLDGKPVEVGFYMWPLRVGFLTLISVQGPVEPMLTGLRLVPGAGTDAVPAKALSLPDGAMKDLSWHEVSPTVRGAWTLELTSGIALTPAEGSAPAQDASIPRATLSIDVAGPPELPRWQAWIIACLPLLGLAFFVRTLGQVTRRSAGNVPWWEADTRGSSR